LVDHYSYAPAFTIAAVLPLAGMGALFWLAPGLAPVRFSQAGSSGNP
jgi:hypothetical protein